MSAAITTADPSAWRAALPCERSVFGSVEFAAIQERQTGVQARLAVAGEIAMPLALRPLEELPFAAAAPDARHDATTPPFTGPLRLGPGADPAAFAAGIGAWAQGEGIVAEFAHLHPWSADQGAFGPADVAGDREIVWVDVQRSDDELLASFSKACRKNLRRAEREGVRVRPGEGERDVEEFHRIYEATMERRDALAGYRFQRAYFEDFMTSMGSSARFALAEHAGRVIAATLYLHDDEDVYSYLGGADHADQALRPTNAVVWETIRWAREMGKRRLVLGGGYRPDDGIFRFKASFSPLRANLSLARTVRMPAAYEALCRAWLERGGDPTADYFPLYRAPAG